MATPKLPGPGFRRYTEAEAAIKLFDPCKICAKRKDLDNPDIICGVENGCRGGYYPEDEQGKEGDNG
jgi:hypothetical protein